MGLAEQHGIRDHRHGFDRTVMSQEGLAHPYTDNLLSHGMWSLVEQTLEHLPGLKAETPYANFRVALGLPFLCLYLNRHAEVCRYYVDHMDAEVNLGTWPLYTISADSRDLYTELNLGA